MPTQRLTEVIDDFLEFLAKNLCPARDELINIKEDKSRKHLQKLVYTNLVDRFDTFIDKVFLEMIEMPALQAEMLEKRDQVVKEADVLRIFLAESPRKDVISRLQETLRTSVLRQRHSVKLSKLLMLIGLEDKELKKPRVSASTGKILESYKPQNNTIAKIPASIIGYSDWLYSKRNAIIHGGGKNGFLKNDKEYLHQTHKVSSESVMIRIGSINTTVIFYQDVAEIIKNGLESSHA